MSGKVTFIFDDGFASHFHIVYPMFREFSYPCCLALITREDLKERFPEILGMQAEGWEILCHSHTHPRMREPISDELARQEIVDSKKVLEDAGFVIRGFVTPCSEAHPSLLPYFRAEYDYAFTHYTNSAKAPIEELVLERPVNRYGMHRCGIMGKTDEELRAYIDYVSEHDEWIVFYDHDIGAGKNITETGLRNLLSYIREKNVAVMTAAQALDSEKCRTKILRDGWDGRQCLVHARAADDGNGTLLLTTQMLNVAGSDDFGGILYQTSRDGGKTWTSLVPVPGCGSVTKDGIRTVMCDVTPMFHKKTGKFLLTGHTAQYREGDIVPIGMIERRRAIPYLTYDAGTETFSCVKTLALPKISRYRDASAGCGQCFETVSGDVLLPFRYLTPGDTKTVAQTVRCSFDGETLLPREYGNILSVPSEARGIGELSVIGAGAQYFMTARGDRHGYICRSTDGIRFSDPEILHFDTGEVVPTYNTQSHVFVSGDRLYIVYTRKNGHNDHVFRHRAPLYAAEIDKSTLRVIRDTEFIAVPERGARLGNFGVFPLAGDKTAVIVTEWMQPSGCEKYGSDNAMWFSDITI